MKLSENLRVTNVLVGVPSMSRDDGNRNFVRKLSEANIIYLRRTKVIKSNGERHFLIPSHIFSFRPRSNSLEASNIFSALRP